MRISSLSLFLILSTMLATYGARAQTTDLAQLQALASKAAQLQFAGKNDEAITVAVDIVEQARERFGTKHIVLVRALSNLALLHDMGRRFSEAEQHYKEALAIMEIQSQPDKILVADLKNNLAAVSIQQCKVNEATQLYRQALDLYQQARGDTHPDTLMVKQNVKRIEKLVQGGSLARNGSRPHRDTRTAAVGGLAPVLPLKELLRDCIG